MTSTTRAQARRLAAAIARVAGTTCRAYVCATAAISSGSGTMLGLAERAVDQLPADQRRQIYKILDSSDRGDAA